MAERTVIDIDVNSDEFKRFAEAFDKYQKALKSTLDDWKKVNQEMGKGRPGGGGGSGGGSNSGTGFFGFDLRIFERVRNEVEKITHGFRDIERMAKPGGSLYGLIGQMPGGAPGLQLLAKMAAGGPIAAGLTALAAGFGGAIAMAPGAADERRRTLGMGVGVTEARAFAAGMGRNILGDPNSALQALASAQFSITSRERGAMNQLFGARGAQAELGKDRTTAMFDILEAMRKKLETYKPELRQSMASSLGFENLVPYGDIQAWMSQTPKQREEAKNAALSASKDAKEQADQVKEATDRLAKLNTSMQRAETAFSNLATTLVAKFTDPLIKAADSLTDAFGKLTKTGFGSIHTGPMTKEDIERNKALGYDPLGGRLNPDGKTSSNFPNGLDQPPVPWWRQKNFGFGFQYGAPPAGPGNAAWTPGPTAYASDGADSEWMKKWFMQESAATKSAADAAEKRDQQITNLLDYLIGHKGGTAAAAGAADGVKAALGSAGGGLTFGNATGSIMPKGGGATPNVTSLFGGAGATVASGNLKKNQDEAYAAAKQAGLSDNAARALVANFSGESLRDPSNTTGDRGQAQGIAQWHRDRANAIFAKFGKYPAQMSVAEQTKAAIWEMQTNPAYKQSWAALQGGGSAENMVGTLVSNYERPGDPATATAQRMRFLHGLTPGKGGGPLAATAGPANANFGVNDSGDVISHLKTMRDKGLITNEQCVSLATASVGIRLGGKGEGAWTGDWRRGDAAAGGGLKAGTPIATFLNRQGVTGDTYAIGGHGGQMGAGLDHAAVFESYVHDAAGRIVGMKVAEQYKGSGGVRERSYMFGGGRGERDARNYYAIKTAAGKYLGGSANPMSGGGDGGGGVMSAGTPGPMAMLNWQQPDRRNRFTVNSNFGADINVQAATLVS